MTGEGKLRVCIVGGGGGASNAANVIRSLDKEATIKIFTNRGEIGNLPCEIPFVLGGTLPSWESSLAFKERFYTERNIEVYLNTEVTGIDIKSKTLIAGGESHHYDKAILDLGAVPVIPSLPGLDGRNEFFLTTGFKPAKAFEEAISKYSTAAILGAGQIALEVAAILKEKGYRAVYLVGRSEHIMRAYLDSDMVGIIEDKVKEKNIELILSAKIVDVKTEGEKKHLSLSDGKFEVDFVFFAAGVKPNTELARRAGIEVGETGAVAVNEYLQTSNPDIYAIGDCMENRDMVTGNKIVYHTATNAARTGRIAGRNLVLGKAVWYQGTVMPFITEIFGYEVGMVGLTEAYAIKQGFDVVSSITTTSTRRRVFGGKPIHIKLIADRRTGNLIGAQLIGKELIAGKVDRLAVAIAERVPVQRLALIDTCYSPTTGAGYEALTMALDELLEKLNSA
jgi:NADPH-dependent 2,4-dienoyl-CoA reductase/sulfur reductase-like enzyme